MKKPPFVDSKNLTIKSFNKLVYSAFPPTWSNGCWLYGRLYFYGDHQRGDRDTLRPQWYLDGMTPVGPWCVMGMLKALGKDVEKYENFFEELGK